MRTSFTLWSIGDFATYLYNLIGLHLRSIKSYQKRKLKRPIHVRAARALCRAVRLPAPTWMGGLIFVGIFGWIKDATSCNRIVKRATFVPHFKNVSICIFYGICQVKLRSQVWRHPNSKLTTPMIRITKVSANKSASGVRALKLSAPMILW